MSFLTPLYIAGILAVSLPILFHLIRRTPRQRMEFSSLMLVPESPPRITRRSRLENLLLLFLRGLALCLIALAFARPFLRGGVQTDIATHKERLIAVLIDTSASMRRGDLWQQAAQQVNQLLRQTLATDRIALLSFDRHLRTEMSFDQWLQTPTGQRAALVSSRMRGLSPGWAASNLGAALSTAAEVLDSYTIDAPERPLAERRILLISDLQRGCDLTALRQYKWPDQVRVQLATLRTPSGSNAGIQAVSPEDREEQVSLERRLRVRISNAADAQRDRFQVRWDTPESRTADVYVPAGKDRVVQAPPRPADSSVSSLILEGDDHPFDNVAYLPPPRRQTATVLYVGRDSADDPGQLRFYLERAFPDSERRSVRVLAHDPDEALSGDATDVRLVILGEAVSPDRAEALRRFLKQGGTVLSVLTSLEAASNVGYLLELDAWQAAEASVQDFALLGQVDLRHPVFAPFAELRFGDFTKIHFWKHRKIDVTSIPEARVLASFDDGDPALVEVPLEKGALFVLTSGWHPDDSQLALSSKFVPLLTRILEQSQGQSMTRRHYRVGDSVPLPEQVLPPLVVRLPNQTELALTRSQERAFTGTSLPGVYTLLSSSEKIGFAVNLDPAESRTGPLAVEELERLGVRLTAQDDLPSVIGQSAGQRHMRAIELEGQQKLWRWLILTALLVLLAETWLAGRLSNYPQRAHA